MGKSLFRIDFGLLLPALILAFFGLSGILSLSTDLFKSQIVFLVISLIAYLIFSQINYQSMKTLMIPIYITSIILLGILLLIGIESRGSVRWVEFFGFRIQISEILKPFLALSLSSFLMQRQIYSFKNFSSILILTIPIFLLIFLQPDLGNALIYLIAVLLVLFTFGFSLKYFVGLLFIAGLSFPILWNFLKEYQKQRILTFLQPGSDPLGTSYNAVQSIIAVGSGAIFGKGYGQGTQSILRFLPERHTDFIFATLSEELGFLGTLLIIVTFSFLIYRIFVISRKTKDVFVKIFAICTFYLLSVQFFINSGMNIGIVPIVGVTLPFVSYGGSSLLSCFILLGLLTSMNKGLSKKETLEIR